ncbi:hypothetical protein [Paenibacillus sp. y28]|uniref:hypothetical protein n=1 Tax=Paenibacillus sp. y28 TaxID=3129110 RepID=UPI003017279A
MYISNYSSSLYKQAWAGYSSLNQTSGTQSGTESSQTNASSTVSGTGSKDSARLSSQAMEMFKNGQQGGPDTQELTADEMRERLARLKERLNSESSGAEATTQPGLLQMKDVLNAIDLSIATDEELSGALDKIDTILQENRPSPFQRMSAQSGHMAVKAAPPEQGPASLPELSADEMKQMLTQIQNDLRSVEADSLTDTGAQSLVKKLQETLSGTDLSTATDEELASLMDSVGAIMEESLKTAETTQGKPQGPPPMGGKPLIGPPPAEGTIAESSDDASSDASFMEKLQQQRTNDQSAG